MAAVRFSQRAEADLLEIAGYTLRTWGEDQAVRYLDGLEACCERLAENPMLGRGCERVRPGLRRMECGRHTIFYRLRRDGVLISRILHQRMLPESRVFED